MKNSWAEIKEEEEEEECVAKKAFVSLIFLLNV